MLARTRDLHRSSNLPAQSRFARQSPHTGYRPKFTITPRLSAQIAIIDATRHDVLVLKGQTALSRDLQERQQAPNSHKPFTLERVLAMATGDDFPVVTESREQEVLKFYATSYRRESLSGQHSWTFKEILALHKAVTAGEGLDQGRAGEFRSVSVRTRNFVPPPPGEVPQLMLDLLQWWNSRARRLPAVITSAILHYRISCIHPFSDGNGRFARALALWQLYRSGFFHSRFSLNGHYWGKRHQYKSALRAVTRQGEDLTTWLEYSAAGLKRELGRTKQG